MGDWDAGMGDNHGIPKLRDAEVVERDKEWIWPYFGMGPWPRNAGKLQWFSPFHELSLSLLQSDPSLKDPQLWRNLWMMR